MNRSKLFLALTTCFLAISGITATNIFSVARLRYYYTAGLTGTSGNCLNIPKGCVFDNLATSICTVLYGSQRHVTYTKSNCTVLLTYSHLEI
jgi:hypothetical protein